MKDVISFLNANTSIISHFEEMEHGLLIHMKSGDTIEFHTESTIFTHHYKGDEEEMNEKKWFDIEGSIETNVDEDTFNKEFLEWVESKGWSFIGIIKTTEEDEDKWVVTEKQEGLLLLQNKVEYLKDTIAILVNYDNENTVEGLKALIDETRERLVKILNGEVEDKDLSLSEEMFNEKQKEQGE